MSDTSLEKIYEINGTEYDNKGNELFEVEKVIDKKRINRVLHYLIKWEGYSEEDNTWEKAS